MDPSSATPLPNVYDPSGAPVDRVEVPIDLARAELPATVILEGRSFLVTEPRRGEYALLSTVCPHAGGQVVDKGSHFECPNHLWRFDNMSGECINTPGQRLSRVPIEIEDGRMFAAVPPPPPARPRHPSLTRRALRGISIAVHAHATLELSYGGFSLLTDPWLDGPAFLGAWDHHPRPLVSGSDLAPDAIWISHDHSDHFHLPTLERFDRATPLYMPDFPNRQVELRCRAVGFSDVNPMPFGERFALAPDFHITCFEPASLWNDAIVLVEMGSLRFLNLNDAGINRRIASLVAPVDVIASSFSQRASSYPATWQHLTEERKADIIERGEAGALEMLRGAVEAYGATHILPFASHFTLWHPTHREHSRTMNANTVADVVEAFETTGVTVLDVLPGERFDGDAHAVDRRPDGGRHEAPRFDAEIFARHHPSDGAIDREAIEAYLLSLNETTEIAFSEELSVTLRTTDLDYEPSGPEVGFVIRGGRLEILAQPVVEPNLLVEMPAGVLAHLIEERLPWDEADIGYWCRYHRAPDVFHAGFWRLIHSPYYARPADAPPAGDALGRESVIAEVLERYGAPADRVMRRYGLYCVGCRHSGAESIELGGRQHGIEESTIDRLVTELQSLAA